VTFIVLEKEAPTQVGEALMCSVLVPHASAKLQNDREAFQPGDMICLTGRLFSFHKSNLVLCTGKERNDRKDQ
jgi:hypothetical protein